MVTLKTDFIDGNRIYAGSPTDTGSLNGITHQINLNTDNIGHFKELGAKTIDASSSQTDFGFGSIGSITVGSNELFGNVGYLHIFYRVGLRDESNALLSEVGNLATGSRLEFSTRIKKDGVDYKEFDVCLAQNSGDVGFNAWQNIELNEPIQITSTEQNNGFELTVEINADGAKVNGRLEAIRDKDFMFVGLGSVE